MSQVLLDRQGIFPLRENYFLVTSDVEFLQLALSGKNLQICGNVCNWAKPFFEGRQISCQELRSPIEELTEICNPLDESQSRQILRKIGIQRFEAIERPLSIGKILNAISPGNIWENEPTTKHAAEWLLWLIEFKPEIFLEPLLKQITNIWMNIFHNPERNVYNCLDDKSALSILNGWLGINASSDHKKWGDFPLIVPAEVKSKASEYWKKQIVETKGGWIDDGTNWPGQNLLRKTLAFEAYKYFKNNPNGLTQERFDSLSEFLSWQEQKELQAYLPPIPVSNMPIEPESVLNWFVKEYLPYRRWQYGNNDENAMSVINEQARLFAFWYLENYPKALSGSDMRRFLSFAKAATVTNNNSDYVILIIVLDGLHVGDAHSLELKILEIVPRLSQISDEVVFTAIPTVTEFCKEALFKGVPPAQVDKVLPIGTIIPENEMPNNRITNANIGDSLFWRIQEPDHTYHSRNSSDALFRKVEAEIDSIAKIVQDIVEDVASEIPLQIIITTDHGRLIAKSKRKFSIPEGMESHGRSAWGPSNKEFGITGYIVEDDLVIWSGERFGLLYDVAVPLTEDAFLTSDGRAGQEAFSHGGLYPEEVIIPWITYIRDIVKPNVEITITGHAVVGKPGTIIINGTNLSNVNINISFLELFFGDIYLKFENQDFQVPKMSTESFNLDLQKWPSNVEIKKSRCNCQITQPNGLTFNVEGLLEIQSDGMYQGDSDNILEDLV